MTYQINTFIATMDNYGKVTEYTTEAMNSAGTAQEKYGAYMDSIQAHLNQLTTTWQEFVLNLDQSGTFNSIIDAASGFINVLDVLLNKFKMFDYIAIPALFASLAGVISSKTLPALLKMTTTVSSGLSTFGSFFKTLKNGFDISSDLVGSFSDAFIQSFPGIVSNINSFKSGIESSGGVLKFLTSGTQAATAALSGLSAAFSVGVGVISLVVMAIQNHNAELERSLQLARDNAQTYANETQQINSLISEYTELNDKLDDNNLTSEEVASTKDRLAEIQESLNSLYGDEKTNIDLTNGSYEEQLEILKELNREKALQYLSDNKEGIKEAEKQVDKGYTVNVGALTPGTAGSYSPFIGLDKETINEFEEYLKNTFGDSIRTQFGQIKLDIDAKDAEQTFQNLYDSIQQFEADAGVDLSRILNNLLDERTRTKLDEAEQNWQTALEAQKARAQVDLETTDSYTNLTKAVYEYNNALMSGDTSKIEETNQRLQDVDASAQKLKEEYPDAYQDVIDSVIETTETVSEETPEITENMTDELADVAENVDLSGIIEALEDVEDTDIDSDIFEDLVDAADDAGVSFEDLIDKMVEVGKITPEVGNKIKSAFHTSILKELQQDIQNTIGQMAAFDSNWDTLTSAVEEFNQAGYLSAATLQSLTDNNLLEYLQLSANGLEIDRQAFLNNAEAVKAKAIEDVKAEAFIKLCTIALQDNAAVQAAVESQAYATGSAVEQAAADFASSTPSIMSVTTAANAMWAALRGQGMSGGTLNMSKASAIINDMNNKIKIIQNTTYKAATAMGSVASGAGRAAGGLGSAADNARKLKEELEDAQDAINDYIDMVADMIKQEMEDQKDALEDEKDALEDKKDAALDAIDEEAEAMDRYYEDLRDQMDREKELADRNFEDRKEQLENLKDRQDEMFEDQKEALEDELDAYEEKIEAEKELLKQKEEERKYEQDLADKVKDVAKIQSELAALQFDDSIEAQKKKIELTEELAERQEELDEFQAEHSSELKEDALDKELERYEKSHEEKIKDIEEQQAAYEKMIDAQISALEQEQKAYERAHEDKLYALEQEQKEYERNIEDRKKLVEQEYDNEIAKIEEKIEAVSDAMDKEGEIIQEAIRRIEEDAEGTYQALLEWNRQYGSGIDSDVIEKWNSAKAALEKYRDTTGSVVSALDNIKNKLKEIEDTANKASGAAGGLGGAFNQLPPTIDKINLKIGSMIKLLQKVKLPTGEIGWKNTHSGEIYTKNHNGTGYVEASDEERKLSKRLGLKSDEVVRVLKVGEAVIPKEKNLQNIRNTNTEIENIKNIKSNTSNNVQKITNSSSKNYITESPVTSVSIGDIVIQGNADSSTVSKLSEIRDSLIKDVFAKINKHTNLSGFRNVKGYV